MTNPNFHPASYKQATGNVAFGLTNDYMFRTVFQKNQTALKGLISSVLHMSPEEINLGKVYVVLCTTYPLFS